MQHNVQNQRIVLVVAGCKCDLVPTPGLEEQIKMVADRFGAIYVKTSAKNDVNVTDVFRRTATTVLQCQQEAATGRGRPIHVTLGGMSLRNPNNRSFSPTAVRSNSARNIMSSGTSTPQQHTPQKPEGQDSSTAGDSDDHVLDPDDGLNSSNGPKIMCDNGMLLCASADGTSQACIIL